MMNNKLALLMVTLTAFFWGSNFNIGAKVVAQVSPLVAASERFILASLLILIFMFFKDKDNLTTLKKNLTSYLLLGLCGISGFNIAFFIGLQTTSPINGALIMATSPIVTVLIATIIDKHRITGAQAIGMLVSLIGVILVISHGNIMNVICVNFNQGDMMIMLGNLAWAIYTVGCRKYISHSTPLQTACFTMLFGTLGIVLFSICQVNFIASLTHITFSNHLLLIYMAVAGSVLAYLFWNVGIKELGVANTSVFFNLVPVFTMLLTLMTGVIPNVLQLIGATLVIGGVIYTTSSYQLIFRKP